MLPPATTPTGCSLPLSDLSLIVQRIKDPSLRARLVGLSGDDAQYIADFLSTLLHEGTFSPEDKRYLLTLLQKLVKSTQVLPQSYKLQDIQCDFSQAREGGAFADIYQGEYQERKVCVKAVRIFQRGDNTRMLRAFAKEIVVWAHLSHENILPFYGIYRGVSGRICIISPWMDGGDLSAYLQSFPHRPRLPLASDVTAGLQHLHQLNIVHGDLKAKNILVSDSGRALIADFGISLIVVSRKLPSTQLSSGTMRWMAPELLKDDEENAPSVTLQSDVWSLGCVFYEIWTRRVPFYHCVSDARVSLTRLDPTAVPSRPTDGNEVDNISDAMWDLMKWCWDHDPCSRPDCNNVHECIIGLIEAREQQCPQDDTIWNSNRGETGVGTIYERASHILLPPSSNSLMQGDQFYSPIVGSLFLADTQQPSQSPKPDHGQEDSAYAFFTAARASLMRYSIMTNVLKTICDRQRWTFRKGECFQSGPQHQPVWVGQVFVNGAPCEGEGTSKRAAWEEAARICLLDISAKHPEMVPANFLST